MSAAFGEKMIKKWDYKENFGSSSVNQSKHRRMGSLKGQRLISEGYDIDESNDEIAKMFGVG